MTTHLDELYRNDFYAWARNQAEALGRWHELRPDEEIDGLADADFHAVCSQLRRLIAHLLKLAYSHATDPRAGWIVTCIDARAEIEDRLTNAMRPQVEAAMPRIRDRGRRLAVAGLKEYKEPDAAAALPATCPWTLDQLLDPDWYPANVHGVVDEIVSESQ